MAAESSKKVPTNLSVRGDLVARARALGLNLSRVLEGALEDAIAEHERTAWLAENGDAIDAYNERLAERAGRGGRGVFSDDWRRF